MVGVIWSMEDELFDIVLIGPHLGVLQALHPDDLQVAVVFYGRPVEGEMLKDIKCPLLGIYGTNDSQFPKRIVDSLEDSLEKCPIPFKISRYEGQSHAFVKDLEAIEQGGPATQAWEEFISFLGIHMQRKDVG